MEKGLLIPPQEKDLGDFPIHRVLPSRQRRMVGPFVFLDHMGPAVMSAEQPMAVRPHPHIGLSTLTYLLEGKIHHRDSLGTSQVIEPGAVNWMTAGRGIVHSERSPTMRLGESQTVHGLQCWVALPAAEEECAPRFEHFPAESFQWIQLPGCRMKLLFGAAFGQQSPAKAHSELLFAEVQFDEDSELELPLESREVGVYCINGEVSAGSSGASSHESPPFEAIPPHHLWVAPEKGESILVKGSPTSVCFLLGGRNIGPRFIWWNLVATSKEKLDAGREDWRHGPRADSPRFHPVPGDDVEFIPGPE